MNTSDLPQLNTYGTGEIYRLLKLGEFAHVANVPSLPADLPVANISQKPAEMPAAAIIPNKRIEALKQKGLKLLARTRSKHSQSYVSTIFRKLNASWVVYPTIFALSYGVFYFGLNFPSLTAQAQSWFTLKSQDQQQLGPNLDAYYKWINGYYYAVSDKSLLSPNNDIDHDGLTNYDEFIMQTNPLVADSSGDGISDGVKVLDGMNPWGKGPMTPAQKSWRDKLDLTLISERIAASTASATLVSDNSKDNVFDLNRNGQLSIPKLNMQVPLIWSRDPSSFDNDLEHGVIHYPGTALPGEQGVMYVSGHSSDYIWKHDPFSTVFTTINRLSPGDDVYVTVYGVDGKSYVYRYQVTGNKIYSPDDQTQFIDANGSKLNLSTCWPIGTSKDRLVVTAQLIGL